ncbi:phage major capsid protein [Gordonia alkaliphila]|uniref:Phage major capsid protein n=1 Tax=Gordonia alkaliphila TaxID=1053547 RepID=A0ABP8ZGF1_9ACTN
MAVIDSTGLVLPRDLADGMIRKTQDGSVVAQLSTSEPFRFGDTDIVTVNQVPKAEFVGEGADKGSTNETFGYVTARPRKAQTTLRFNEEVQWRDQDYQLGVLNELATAAAESMPRALDLGVLHAINPLSGAALSGTPDKVAGAVNVITAAGDPEAEVEAAIALHLAPGGFPTGVALSPDYAFAYATQRYPAGHARQGELINPGLPLNPREIGAIRGLGAAVSDTVAAPEATDAAAKKIKAIVGNWSRGLRWGVARTLPIEIIRFGDPDGQGDLKRKNQIALRLETAWVWYVDPTKFTLVKAA